MSGYETKRHLQLCFDAGSGRRRRCGPPGGAVERSEGITLRTYADKWVQQRQLRPRTHALCESMLEPTARRDR